MLGALPGTVQHIDDGDQWGGIATCGSGNLHWTTARDRMNADGIFAVPDAACA